MGRAGVEGGIQRGEAHTARSHGFVGTPIDACLKFTADGMTRYYGGGMDGKSFATAQEVLKGAFWGLVWLTDLKGKGGRIEDIVATYNKKGAG